jgi:hypothetical protein
MSDKNNEREQFEAWAELTDHQKHGAKHDVTGWYYFDEVTQDRWEAWQARAELSRQAAPEAPADRQNMTHADMLALCAANPAAASGLPLKYLTHATVSMNWKPVHQVSSMLFPNCWHDITAEEHASYVQNKAPVRTLYRSQEAQAAHAGADTDICKAALENLLHSLPDILPNGAYKRFLQSGKWATGTSYALRGIVASVEYRADDMEMVYAAIDAARAAIATSEQKGPQA